MIELRAEIKNLKYKKIIETPLKEIECSLYDFDINVLSSTFILKAPFDGILFAISKWVSPKRTRSYPYARVYDTLFQPVSKVVTVIPIVKDEGKGSNTDYLQWDTVALLSLLNVYVVITYYSDACMKIRRKKNGEVIKTLTAQKFNNEIVVKKLKELSEYGASALHWNLKELEKENLESIINRAKKAYEHLSEKYDIELPSVKGLDNLLKKIQKGVDEFKNFSREKAKAAQRREVKTEQPKEALSNLPKVGLTIKNYLGGFYRFTVDEFDTENCQLIEAKHSSRSKFPKANDIKDALLKMVLYTNLENLRYNDKICKSWKPILKLTSSKLNGNFKGKEILNLVSRLSNKKFKKFFEQLLKEAELNGFEVILRGIKR